MEDRKGGGQEEWRTGRVEEMNKNVRASGEFVFFQA